MLKLLNWCKEHILFISTLFLLAFIPLYPKLPLFNIQNTWVYIRLEDFFVLGSLVVWFYLMGKKKVSLNTPLTGSLFLFWMVGGIATVHGVLLIFPTIANVFPNVALFSYIRRIEYMSVFFISYWGIRDKKQVSIALTVLVGTVIAISAYGLGQRYFGFPAFLTMNEEFAKGIPLTLSALSRVPSTFGGHYDLAAYLVLVLPIVLGMMFGGINRLLIPVVGAVFLVGVYVLFLTVSRISLIALVVAGLIVLVFYTKRLILYMIPIVLCVAAGALYLSPNLLARYASTLTPVDILTDAKTGTPIGKVTTVQNTYFADKVVRQQNFTSPRDYVMRHESMDINSPLASVSGIIIPHTKIPPNVPLMVSSIVSTGEDLPQGTGYVNLPLSPISKSLNNFYYEIVKKDQSGPVEVQVINGPYLIKKSLAYDLSYTTRFQGEWPHALAAFRKNIFLGSGYGSVSLAVDNSYLRMLAEVGTFGTLAFFGIFVMFGIVIYTQMRSLESPLVKSLIVGLSAGIVGLCINAIFIDVFEASKVAFTLWLLVGIALGALKVGSASRLEMKKEVMKVLSHPLVGILSILVVGYTLYGVVTTYYFHADDFTWLHWAANCAAPTELGRCPVNLREIGSYFSHADGFFYRPGTKIYFLLMQSTAWLNQSTYHLVSLVLHLFNALLVYLLLRKVLRRDALALVGGMLFVIIGGYSEAVIWISAVGFLFTTFFILVSLFATIRWYETGSRVLFISAILSSIIAAQFHELGIVSPLISLAYVFIFLYEGSTRAFIQQKRLWYLLTPIPVYLIARLTAGSHWFNGDYSYNIVKLPLNSVGNAIGYLAAILGGPQAVSIIDMLRIALRSHLLLSTLLGILLFVGAYRLVNMILKTWGAQEKRVAAFGTMFFLCSLLPFLGLGNIALRYGYMATIGIVILLVICVSKLYEYLLVNGEDVARYSTVVFFSIFLLFQFVQRHKMLDNWQESGEKIRRSVVSLNAAYTDEWATLPMELHIVNLPIKNGYAWVYPVGFSDMVWFMTKNDSVRIFYDASTEKALDMIEYGSKTQRVFEFDSSGELIPKHKEWRDL
jgi:hypothetical protein